MVISFFKNNPGVSLILVPLIAVACWFFAFFNIPELNVKHAMPLYEVLGSWFKDFKLGAPVLAALLVIGEAFYLNYIIDKNEIVEKGSYLPAFLYVLFMSCSPPFLTLHQIIPANLFLLFALNSLFSMYRKESAFGNAFDAGFFIGIAALFYFPSIMLFIVIWMGFIVLRPFIWREWVISFLGLLVPFIFATVYYFWFDILDYLWYDKMFYPISARPFTFDYPDSYYVLFYTSIVLLLLSLIALLNTITMKSIRARGILVILLWFMVLGFLSFIIAPQISGIYLTIVIIPFSVFASNYLVSIKKKWWAELLMLIILSIIFFIHIENILN